MCNQPDLISVGIAHHLAVLLGIAQPALIASSVRNFFTQSNRIPIVLLMLGYTPRSNATSLKSGNPSCAGIRPQPTG
jgi:hypothetical protein